MPKRALNFIHGFTKKCVRVWHVLRKPSKEEFTTIAKVSAIGIILLGIIGFIISIAIKLTIGG
jgi:protein transport protein SEC61 subunit gamma-like protein